MAGTSLYRNFPVPDVLLHRSTAASDGRNRKYQYFHPGEDQAMDRNEYTIMLIIAIVVVALLVGYFFKYTKFGKYTKAIGANEVVAEQSGVNTTKWKVFAYMAFGATVAIGSFIMLTRTGSAGKGTGTGFAMDVMICLILGGMPLSGGMKSKVSSALIGTFTYVLLSNDLTTMGVDLNMINFLKAVIFIIIVMITCRKRDGVLPR